MKKQLFTLLTLLLVSISSAWAETAVPTTAGTYSFGSTSIGASKKFKQLSTNSVFIYRNSVWNTGQSGIKASTTNNSGFVFYLTSPMTLSVTAYANTTTAETVTLYVKKVTSSFFQELVDGTDNSTTTSDYPVLTNVGTANTTSPTTKSEYTINYGSTLTSGYYYVYVQAASSSNQYHRAITLAAAPTYKVTYKANGGTGDDVVDNAATNVADCSFTPPSGKGFVNWNTTDVGDGTAYAVGAAVTSDLTLFAQWADAYAVTFDLQGHGSAIDAQNVVSGGKVSEPTAPTADGYAFGGWYKEAGCTNEWDFDNDVVTTATTLYAKWTKTAQKIIYSLTAGIGSEEGTAGTYTVTPGELLSLGNTAGRIKLTAKTGEEFKNGDNISFTGTVGSASDLKTYGIYYGPTTDLGKNIKSATKVNAASAPSTVNGTLDLAAATGVLYIARYDGTTTNMTSFVISRAMAITSEAFTGVKKSGSALTADAATNGYSVSTNTITLSNDITYTATPTDITLTKHVVFTDASENDNDVTVTFDGTITDGYYIGTANINETDYTVKAKKFVPAEPSDPTVEGTTVTLNTTANMDGWRSYNNNTAKKYTVSANTKVYYASATGENKVTLAEIDGGVPANTAVILHKTDAAGAAAEIVLTETDASITAPGAANKLAVSTAGQNLGKVYRLGYKASDGVGFYTYTTTSAPAGIIYVSSVSSANFLGLDFEDGETTGVASVEKAQTTTDREFYNLAGQRVAQPTKGLYIVNGKKVLVK